MQGASPSAVPPQTPQPHQMLPPLQVRLESSSASLQAGSRHLGWSARLGCEEQ